MDTKSGLEKMHCDVPAMEAAFHHVETSAWHDEAEDAAQRPSLACAHKTTDAC